MAKVYTDVKTLSVNAGELTLSSNAITSTNSVISINPAGEGSIGVVESYGVLKVIDDDDIFADKTNLIIQAADGLGQTTDFDPTLINTFKFTSLMLKDRLGNTYPWITLENQTSGPNILGRTFFYCRNDLVLKLSSNFGVQAFYPIITTDAADATSAGTGSIRTSGGIGVTKDVFVGGSVNFGSNDAVIKSTSGICYSPNLGVTKYPLQYGHFTQTVDTVVNVNVITDLVSDSVSTGVGTLLIPANSLKIGSTLLFKCGGTFNTRLTNTCSLLPRIGVGITGYGELYSVNSSSGHWTYEVQFCVRSLGVSGQISSVSYTTFTDAPLNVKPYSLTGTIDTTGDYYFSLRAIWALPTSTIVCTTATLSTIFHP